MLHKNRLKLQALGLLFVLSGMVLLGLGGLSFLEYSLPMALGRYDVAAERLSIGSRAVALYNQAYVAKEEHRWADAAKSCDSAFSALCDHNGQVLDGQGAFAAEIQFMLASTQVELHKHEEAIAAYDRFLALMPDEITSQQGDIVRAARRTREWLRQSTKSTGKAQTKPNKDPMPTKSMRKRRI